MVRCSLLQDGENRKEVLLAGGAMYLFANLLNLLLSSKQYRTRRLSRVQHFLMTVRLDDGRECCSAQQSRDDIRTWA